MFVNGSSAHYKFLPRLLGIIITIMLEEFSYPELILGIFCQHIFIWIDH